MSYWSPVLSSLPWFRLQDFRGGDVAVLIERIIAIADEVMDAEKARRRRLSASAPAFGVCSSGSQPSCVCVHLLLVCQIGLFFVDRVREQLFCVVSSDSKAFSLSIHHGIVGRVARTGQTLNIENAGAVLCLLPRPLPAAHLMDVMCSIADCTAADCEWFDPAMDKGEHTSLRLPFCGWLTLRAGWCIVSRFRSHRVSHTIGAVCSGAGCQRQHHLCASSRQ